uniref:LysM peptidoglycan-binding domain-containing protein n=1 Tax=Conchiformibius kuhniae TaxID=211502 RepID=A0A8T9MX69_9NEIS|nr:LysM peptidoglycan-binding domain-containing protein [Conchiformibius kuhniae]
MPHPRILASKSKLKVKPNAPARYVVKQGDTLWDISGKYLYRPWQYRRCGT